MPSTANSPKKASALRRRRSKGVSPSPPVASGNSRQASEGDETREDAPTTPPATPTSRRHNKAAKTGTTDTASILKNNVTPADSTKKRSNDGNNVPPSSAPASVPTNQQHNLTNTYKRLLLSTCIKLPETSETKEAHEVYVQIIRELFISFKKADPKLVFIPINQNDRLPPISNVNQIPPIMEDLSKYVRAFSYQFTIKFDKTTGEPLRPVVWATIAISCDEDPEEIINFAAFKWTALGGTRLEIDDNQIPHSKVVAIIVNVHPNVSNDIVAQEAHCVLDQAHQALVLDGELPPEFSGAIVPPVHVSKKTPKIPSSDFKKKDPDESWASKQASKLLHMEVSSFHVKHAALLIEKATQQGLWNKMWGKWAKVSAPLKKKDPLADSQRQADNAHLAMKFAKGTVVVGVSGIFNIDRGVPVHNSQGSIVRSYSLREILLHMFKSPDNVTLFASVHHAIGTSSIEVVIPDGECYHRLVEMMKKCPAAYVFHYLTKVCAMDESFAHRLVEKTMDPEAVSLILDCDWDEETYTLTTPQDKSEDNKMDDLLQQPWMIELDKVKLDSSAKRRSATFRLDDHHTIGTIHHTNDEKRRTAVQFNETFDVTGLPTAKQTVTDLTDDPVGDDDDSMGCHPNQTVPTSPYSTNHDTYADEDMSVMEEAAKVA
ncbi:hypothetical protein ACHAWT_008988 [Skeletonema menzelii]